MHLTNIKERQFEMCNKQRLLKKGEKKIRKSNAIQLLIAFEFRKCQTETRKYARTSVIIITALDTNYRDRSAKKNQGKRPKNLQRTRKTQIKSLNEATLLCNNSISFV